MDRKIAVVGLGYVGLPVAVEFGKLGRRDGFDIEHTKAQGFRADRNPSSDMPGAEMAAARIASYTDQNAGLAAAPLQLKNLASDAEATLSEHGV
jgi:UDP-N-acetyl-D-galactosamine dehydrogenase